MQSEIDEFDWRILEQLQNDARLSYSEVARRVNLSQPTVAERVRRMEESGVITGYHACVNIAALGHPIMAIIRLKIDFPTRREEEIQRLICNSLHEVHECHRITGDDCLLLKAHVQSVGHLEKLLSRLSNYGSPNTAVVLSSTLLRRTVTAGARTFE